VLVGEAGIGVEWPLTMMTRRREFLYVLAGGTVVWPVAAWSQPANVSIIGFLNPASAEESENEPVRSHLVAFRQGLQRHGYVEGRNVRIEYRWADNDYDRLRRHALDLARSDVELIVATGGTVAAQAARGATQSKPIVFLIGGDPVGEGLVSSINRPGGNATGVTLVSDEILAKRIEFLRELTNSDKMAILIDRRTSTAQSEEKLANKLGIKLFYASTEDEIADAFASVRAAEVGGLIITPGVFYTSNAEQIVGLAERHKIPTGCPWRTYAVRGGLMSYGAQLSDGYRQVGDLAGGILKSAQPQDLPVRMPAKFELILNKKAATALGIELPTALLVAADEVIE
jgi:putative tryptophan/tyrosine transport system substrate-binding protein